MTYRLYESAGYLGPFPALADSSDFDTLRIWAVTHNEWKGPKMAAVIVADDNRVWYLSRSGIVREVSWARRRTGGHSQAEKLIARLEGQLNGPHPAYELAPQRGGSIRQFTWGLDDLSFASPSKPQLVR
jgi:hypothetical protein